MKTILKGELEIDHDRGVIYFHLSNPKDVRKRMSMTPLRICKLPTPIPLIKDRSLDITHMVGCDWPGEYAYNKDGITGTEHDFNTDKEAVWEERVFLHAAYFTTYKRVTMTDRRRVEYQNLPDALAAADADPRKTTLVYAVTRTGRQILLVRDLWPKYLAMWKETHP